MIRVGAASSTCSWNPTAQCQAYQVLFRLFSVVKSECALRTISTTGSSSFVDAEDLAAVFVKAADLGPGAGEGETKTLHCSFPILV